MRGGGEEGVLYTVTYFIYLYLEAADGRRRLESREVAAAAAAGRVAGLATRFDALCRGAGAAGGSAGSTTAPTDARK